MARFRQIEPHDIDRIVGTLKDWEPSNGCGAWLHAGDVGWLLRFGRDIAASRLVECVSGTGETILIATKDGVAFCWFAMRADHWMNRELATELADWIELQAGTAASAVDGPQPPAVWRQVLAQRGFEATTDAWAHLWMPLTGPRLDPVAGIESTADPANIADRVAVQKAAFENSTFTVDRWHTMADESIFNRRFDLLRRATNGEPAAAATFWIAGPGKCARLEPLGTHPDHRRQGHGRHLIAGAAAILQAEGASGISVMTPESNVAAVALYRSAGFRRMGLLSEMVRPEATGR